MKALFFPTALSAIVLAWRPLLQGGGDLFGVSRTIDHAVYTLLNSAAVILWRLDAALISMSLFSYNTQDWLTNQNNGGVWQVMDVITGPGGLLGIRAWMVMLSLALTLFGISLLLRPFAFFKPVDLGKMLIFGVFSYVVIQQGSSLMVEVEQWRAELGDYMYEGMAASGSVAIDMPGLTPSSDPLYPPADLDGRPPIRGWEAVSASYFLVTNEAELNDSIPPADFRRAYCLYDPAQPIGDQTAENSQGCSPQKAWDEWDYLGSTGVITAVWGIELPISLGYELPILEEHPENRELAIRQAQGGVARLALGPIVALYPMLEANISLLLALSAAILYLTVPIILLFGFFLYTQPMVSRLLLRFITITINTIILNGLIALFLLLLVNVSVNGSLSAYLGLVGVAVLGGFILTRVAMGTLKETLSVALGAIGGAWMGATTATMGREAAPAARGALGAAKLVGTGALLGAAGMSSLDLAEGGLHTARSGLRDLDHAGLGASGAAKKQAGQLPAPLARLAREGLATEAAAGADPMAGVITTPATAQQPLRGFPSSTGHQDNGPQQQAASAGGMATLLAGGAIAQNGRPRQRSASTAGANSTRPVTAFSQAERQAVWQTVQETQQQAPYTEPNGTLNAAGMQVVADRLSVQGYRAFQGEQGQRDLAGLVAAQQVDSQARGWGVPAARQGRIDDWIAATYQARSAGRGQGQLQAQGRALFGEQLGSQIEQVVARRGQESVEQALTAVRRAAVKMPPEQLARHGQLTPAGRTAVQAELLPETAAIFQGQRGRRDLDRLATAALQPEMTADAKAFRQALVAVQADGKQPPAAAVARRLGLDPVAAGPHFSGINHFVQASDQAGLTPSQRGRLVNELKTDGQVSSELQTEIEATLARQAGRGRTVGVTVHDLIGSAQALPDTLSGPALPGEPQFTGPRKQMTPSGEIPRIEYRHEADAAVSEAKEQAERRQDKPLDIARDRPEPTRRETGAVLQTKTAGGEQQQTPSAEFPRILPLPVAAEEPVRSETAAAIREEAGAAARQPANVPAPSGEIPQMQAPPAAGRAKKRMANQQDKHTTDRVVSDSGKTTAEATTGRQAARADQPGSLSATTPRRHPASEAGTAAGSPGEQLAAQKNTTRTFGAADDRSKSGHSPSTKAAGRPSANPALPASGEIPQIRAAAEAGAVRDWLADQQNEAGPPRSETAAAIREEAAASHPSDEVPSIQPADEVRPEAGESRKHSLGHQHHHVDPAPDRSADPPQVKPNASLSQTAAVRQQVASPSSSPEQPKTLPEDISPTKSQAVGARPEAAGAREQLANQQGRPGLVRSEVADTIRQEATPGSNQPVNLEQTGRHLPSGEIPQIQAAGLPDKTMPTRSETVAAIRQEAIAGSQPASPALPPFGELPRIEPAGDNPTPPAQTTVAETRRHTGEDTPPLPLATPPTVEPKHDPATPHTPDIPVETATEPQPERSALAAELRRALAQKEADIPAGSGKPDELQTSQPVVIDTKIHQPAVEPTPDDREAQHKTPLPPLPTPAVHGQSQASDRPADKTRLDNSAPVVPVDAHDQAGAAAVALGQQQREASSRTEAQQIAAALREQAKADALARDDGQAKPEKRSGSEIKAAALAAASSETARSKLSQDAAAPPAGGPSTGVAAALRRGRVDDEEDEAKAKDKAKAKAEAEAEEKPEPEREKDAEPLGNAGQNISGNREPVVSLLPHHEIDDNETGPSRQLFATAAAAEPDQAEIAADARVAARPKHQQTRRDPISAPDQAEVAAAAQSAAGPKKRRRAKGEKTQQQKIEPEAPAKSGAVEPQGVPHTNPRGRATGPGPVPSAFTASIPSDEQTTKRRKKAKVDPKRKQADATGQQKAASETEAGKENSAKRDSARQIK